MHAFLHDYKAELRAGCVKLANRRAGYLSSLSLIRTRGAQRVILLCEAAGYRRRERRGEAWRTTRRNTAAGGTCGCRCSTQHRSSLPPSLRASSRLASKVQVAVMGVASPWEQFQGEPYCHGRLRCSTCSENGGFLNMAAGHRLSFSEDDCTS